MNIYVKKPIPIHAFQWDGYLKTLQTNISKRDITSYFSTVLNTSSTLFILYVKTLEGVEKCKINDWVIKGVNGEYYVCADNVFKKTYNEIEK